MKRGWWLALVTTLSSLVVSNGAAADQSITALAPFEVFADGFRDLRGIAIDASGNVFVADREAGTVTRIAPNRTRAVVASGLQHPVGLAFDFAGRLLIAEEKANRVVRVEANGGRTPIILNVTRPRWHAVHENGTVFVSTQRLTRDTDRDGDDDRDSDDESDGAEIILALTPSGQLRLFADGFKGLQGLALNHTVLFAATQGRKGDRQSDGVIFKIPILSDGSAGMPVAVGPTSQFKKPAGLAHDRLGALYLTADEFKFQKSEAEGIVAMVFGDDEDDVVGLGFAECAKPGDRGGLLGGDRRDGENREEGEWKDSH